MASDTIKIYRFKGGVHPPEEKLTKSEPVRVMPIPKKVFIPLSQHLGAPAKPIVAAGDRVKVGTKIAEAGGFVSAAVHASISWGRQGHCRLPERGGPQPPGRRDRRRRGRPVGRRGEAPRRRVEAHTRPDQGDHQGSGPGGYGRGRVSQRTSSSHPPKENRSTPSSSTGPNVNRT